MDVHINLIESSAYDYADLRALGGTTTILSDESMPAVRTLRVSAI
jgi:hypothetical protein